jgi:hypothetical protein
MARIFDFDILIFILIVSGIAATGTTAHVRALGCLPSKNMGARAQLQTKTM